MVRFPEHDTCFIVVLSRWMFSNVPVDGQCAPLFSLNIDPAVVGREEFIIAGGPLCAMTGLIWPMSWLLADFSCSVIVPVFSLSPMRILKIFSLVFLITSVINNSKSNHSGKSDPWTFSIYASQVGQYLHAYYDSRYTNCEGIAGGFFAFRKGCGVPKGSDQWKEDRPDFHFCVRCSFYNMFRISGG